MHCVLIAECHHGHQQRKVKYDEREKKEREDVVSMTTSRKEKDLKKLKSPCLSVLLK